jgi:hypothetical protein
MCITEGTNSRGTKTTERKKIIGRNLSEFDKLPND